MLADSDPPEAALAFVVKGPFKRLPDSKNGPSNSELFWFIPADTAMQQSTRQCWPAFNSIQI